MADGVRPGLPFTKMQAVGNDFVVAEEGAWPPETDWAAAAIRLCDRHTGVGADGLMLLAPSRVASLRARMFNPDGTEDFCGNGTRCAVAFAVEEGFVDPTGRVETLSGLIPYVYMPTEGGSQAQVDTVFGPPRFAPDALPMRVHDRDRVFDHVLPVGDEGSVIVSVVSTGTTHTVLWVRQLPDDDLFFRLSPQIENHPLFPERTSVLWARVDGENACALRIWERGAGETLGCGTGAAAVAVLGVEQGKFDGDRPIVVASEGGALTVAYQRGGERPLVILRGTAQTVFRGEWATHDAEG